MAARITGTRSLVSLAQMPPPLYFGRWNVCCRLKVVNEDDVIFVFTDNSSPLGLRLQVT